MLTVEEILDVLLACEDAVGEYAPSYRAELVGRVQEARRSLTFWVAKDRIAVAREQWKAARERGGIFNLEAQNGAKRGEKAGA